jgi:proline racemase/trans-L-3-hydroxyproline dehydratase
MNFIRSINVIDAHTAGEPTRIVVGGIPKIPGATMAEKRSYLMQNLDHLRTMLMHEPRGHRDMFGSIITQPGSDEADIGIIFMDTGGYLNMCGHGTIGAVTVALETGMVKAVMPETKLVLDSPAGLVYASGMVNGSKVTSVVVQNVPAFLYKKDLKLEVPEIGCVTVDIAFGGNFFALVNARELGLDVVPANSRELIRKGIAIKDYINKHIQVQHPEKKHITTVDLTEIYQDDNLNSGSSSKNVVVFGANQFDRSPCGTGTCARMAALHAKGKLNLHQDFVNESIIGTTFIGRVIDQTKVGSFDAIIPQITGSAYIYGFQQLVVDPYDPMGNGFLVG